MLVFFFFFFAFFIPWEEQSLVKGQNLRTSTSPRAVRALRWLLEQGWAVAHAQGHLPGGTGPLGPRHLG